MSPTTFTTFDSLYTHLTTTYSYPVLASQSPNPYSKSLSHSIASLSLHPTLESLLHILNGDLSSAHFLCRHMQNEPAWEGMYIHGLLHRVEGDYRNAEAWYGNVAETECFQHAWGGEHGLEDAKAFIRRIEKLRKEKVGSLEELEAESKREIDAMVEWCKRKFGTGKMEDASQAWVEPSEEHHQHLRIMYHPRLASEPREQGERTPPRVPTERQAARTRDVISPSLSRAEGAPAGHGPHVASPSLQSAETDQPAAIDSVGGEDRDQFLHEPVLPSGTAYDDYVDFQDWNRSAHIGGFRGQDEETASPDIAGQNTETDQPEPIVSATSPIAIDSVGGEEREQSLRRPVSPPRTDGVEYLESIGFANFDGFVGEEGETLFPQIAEVGDGLLAQAQADSRSNREMSNERLGPRENESRIAPVISENGNVMAASQPRSYRRGRNVSVSSRRSGPDSAGTPARDLRKGRPLAMGGMRGKKRAQPDLSPPGKEPAARRSSSPGIMLPFYQAYRAARDNMPARKQRPINGRRSANDPDADATAFQSRRPQIGTPRHVDQTHASGLDNAALAARRRAIGGRPGNFSPADLDLYFVSNLRQQHLMLGMTPGYAPAAARAMPQGPVFGTAYGHAGHPQMPVDFTERHVAPGAYRRSEPGLLPPMNSQAPAPARMSVPRVPHGQPMVPPQFGGMPPMRHQSDPRLSGSQEPSVQNPGPVNIRNNVVNHNYGERQPVYPLPANPLPANPGLLFQGAQYHVQQHFHGPTNGAVTIAFNVDNRNPMGQQQQNYPEPFNGVQNQAAPAPAMPPLDDIGNAQAERPPVVGASSHPPSEFYQLNPEAMKKSTKHATNLFSADGLWESNGNRTRK
ncbi:hypothetical protein LTS10_000182 [Elasticomyces elasticus]|nr:hypothetical protein LTS10_000182 [Elasticomyces elasticus]